ncbi:MAG: hydantoinase B/oxoprolinase family protein [Chloroflexi bacterium]|nr:hydantoinase B/oxoprolinase family protein [Chloroflexota bacterium]
MTRTLDPVKYEIFRHRLFSILEEGRIAMKMVSGSPVVVEGGETMCSLHDAQGRPILVAAGILLHAIGARDFIRKTIEWYEKDPGINDGDQFFFNDPYIGGQHLPDMVIVRPVFYGGKRIAWVGSIMHTPETGGIDPGGSGTRSTQIFHEGIRILGLKIMEGGKFRPEVFKTITEQVRDPVLVGLDTKAKIAANNVCASRYADLVEKFGLEFISVAEERIVADSETMARTKLKSLPDGTWRCRLYGDTNGVQEKPFKVMCTMTKKGDNVTFDYSGSSPQNEGSLNSTRPASWGSLFVVLSSQLFWDVPQNEGLLAPVQLITEEGTVVNCRYPAACANGVQTVGSLLTESAHACIAKMLFAGGVLQDVNSGWRGAAGGSPFYGGMNQYGNPCAGVILDTFAPGIGATPYRDGVDTGGNMMNPTSSISDVEIITGNIPFIYLGRKNATNSGGFGKFAGGMGPQSIVMVYGTDQLSLGVTGACRRTLSNFGMFGGYPGTVQEARMSLNSSLQRWFKESRTVESFQDVKDLDGKTIDPPNSFPAIPVKQYDVLIYHLGSGGGYGDPLDREPSKVVADVKRQAITEDVANKIYGVALGPGKLELDEKGTAELRGQIRKDRLANGRKPLSR